MANRLNAYGLAALRVFLWALHMGPLDFGGVCSLGPYVFVSALDHPMYPYQGSHVFCLMVLRVYLRVVWVVLEDLLL